MTTSLTKHLAKSAPLDQFSGRLLKASAEDGFVLYAMSPGPGVDAEAAEATAWRVGARAAKAAGGPIRFAESSVYRGPDWVAKSPDGGTTTVVQGTWCLGLIADDVNTFTALCSGAMAPQRALKIALKKSKPQFPSIRKETEMADNLQKAAESVLKAALAPYESAIEKAKKRFKKGDVFAHAELDRARMQRTLVKMVVNEAERQRRGPLPAGMGHRIVSNSRELPDDAGLRYIAGRTSR